MQTILVVEDDAEIRELLAEMLVDAGYAVAEAANGQEALDYLRRGDGAPSLILLDLMMPVLSGPELLEIMAADEALSALPVVVISAVAERGTAPGVRRFLKKPVSSAVLRKVVAQYCGGP